MDFAEAILLNSKIQEISFFMFSIIIKLFEWALILMKTASKSVQRVNSRTFSTFNNIYLQHHRESFSVYIGWNLFICMHTSLKLSKKSLLTSWWNIGYFPIYSLRGKYIDKFSFNVMRGKWKSLSAGSYIHSQKDEIFIRVSY